MTTELQLTTTKDDYADILAEFSTLSRDLLLTFRLQVGQLLLDRFFAGSAHAYHDKNPSKESSFVEFARVCQAELNDLGVTVGVARQCILARIAWDGLPSHLRDRLRFSHIAVLARVGEPNLRARLALDTTLQNWKVDELKDAISRANEGTYYDTDPNTPGTQPPAAKPAPEERLAPGRLVSQLVKASQALQQWRQAWSSVDASKLRGSQRQRCRKALDSLKAEIAGLDAELAADEK